MLNILCVLTKICQQNNYYRKKPHIDPLIIMQDDKDIRIIINNYRSFKKSVLGQNRLKYRRTGLVCNPLNIYSVTFINKQFKIFYNINKENKIIFIFGTLAFYTFLNHKNFCGRRFTGQNPLLYHLLGTNLHLLNHRRMLHRQNRDPYCFVTFATNTFVALEVS